jgi:hypothetical protein
MDPLTAGILVVLGKYAIDKGPGLIEEVGPAAAEKAGELFKTALNYLRGKPNGQFVADGFEEDPGTYEKPVAKELETAVQADPEFAARLEELWVQYQQAQYFNRSELKGLCFDMGVAHDDLQGETRSELAQSLVAYCHTRGRLPELAGLCRKQRPNVEWPLP